MSDNKGVAPDRHADLLFITSEVDEEAGEIEGDETPCLLIIVLLPAWVISFVERKGTTQNLYVGNAYGAILLKKDERLISITIFSKRKLLKCLNRKFGPSKLANTVYWF